MAKKLKHYSYLGNDKTSACGKALAKVSYTVRLSAVTCNSCKSSQTYTNHAMHIELENGSYQSLIHKSLEKKEI